MKVKIEDEKSKLLPILEPENLRKEIRDLIIPISYQPDMDEGVPNKVSGAFEAQHVRHEVEVRSRK